MYVYRYRSPGLLSQKGLIYDEWYFASREELNDPIDMQSKFEFPENSKSTWFRVIKSLWQNEVWSELAASYFNSICPISMEQLLEEYDQHSVKVVESIFKNCEINLADLQQIGELQKQLKALLSLYAPSAGYSVSLSTCNNEMLMWSHYAASHTGYCLIYRPIDGYLYQCSSRTKDSLSVSKGHTSLIGNKFKVQAIEYENQLEAIDAFCLLPSYNTGYKFETEEERLGFHAKIQSQLLTKNECWAYEQEARLLLPQPSKYISGESAFTNYQRLFHYDFSQVVGIIFGARMREHEKLAIKEIIDAKLEKRFRDLGGKPTKTHVFDFLYQQAEICSSSRVVRIIDQELISMGTHLKVGTEYYQRQLKAWKEFKGVTMEAGKYSYDAIP
ncbi:DUF2971 domain-containing protein [Vibrio parahaemolyticus]|uniref:DUF2971 domain-containing protein n=1 Tax=Vibrio parahaemolyticus TaxID=670 RepID=UPI001E345353|nr:DUF2971 domain-containing protein [Vibrio parahaemolyticus]MCQ9048846.1 DUF2971 domain-containing protein [Vibrio parahaemolyticus]